MPRAISHEAPAKPPLEAESGGGLPALSSHVYPLDLLPESSDGAATPCLIFSGETPGVRSWSCQTSVLMPGQVPSPLQQRQEEELLVVLDGEMTLEVTQAGRPSGHEQLPIRRGGFVFYPPGFEHSLRPAGTTPAHYLSLRWHDGAAGAPSALGFGRFDAFQSEPEKLVHRDGWTRQRYLAAPTSHLRQLRCHVSTMQAGAGYAVHADPYDVAIVTLEGEVETLGQHVPRNRLIFYSAGEFHGLRNPGAVPAIYLVFEFHSRRMAGPSVPSESLVAKLMSPPRWKRLVKRALARYARR